MCLAVPLKIIELRGETAVVESGGVRREVVVSFLADPRIGDHVLVHAGFAIRKWSEADLLEYHELLRDIELAGQAGKGGAL